MAEFLSSAWIAALDAAASTLPAASIDEPVIVEQQVHGAPVSTDAVTYHFALRPTGARVIEGPATAPDVVVLTDYETARALHEGRTTAPAALAAGRLKIRGRPSALRPLADLQDLFAAVRADTTFG